MPQDLSSQAGSLIKKEKKVQTKKRKPDANLEKLEKAAKTIIRDKTVGDWRLQEETQKEREKGQKLTSVSLEEYDENITQADHEGLDWSPYIPEEDETDGKQKEISINTATIRSIAKKLISREWRRALGKPPHKPMEDKLLSEAAQWREAKDLKKRLAEEKQQKLVAYAESLNATLSAFAEDFDDVRSTHDSKDIDELFKEYLEDLGEVYMVEWSEDGCQVWFEPWLEIKVRRKIQEVNPIIYTAFIDQNFDITTFELDEDDTFLNRVHEEELNEIFSRLEDKNELDDNINLETLLEDALSEKGRLDMILETDTGWEAKLELWETLRSRNQKQLDKEYAQLVDVNISNNNGKIQFEVQSFDIDVPNEKLLEK